MTDRMTWLRTRVQAGVLLLVAGLVLLAASLVAQQANSGSNFNFRIIGGFGIALAGGGIGLLFRYLPAMRSDEAARRVVAEERDERSIQIRQRAASRAYRASAAVIWLGLMWASVGSNSGMPQLEGDTVWNYLVAALAIPFVVYVGSIVVDERNS